METLNPNQRVRLLLSEFSLRLKEGGTDRETTLSETAEKIEKALQSDALLTEAQVVQRYRWLTLGKLRNMRFRHEGPKYHKFGPHKNSRVFYRISDIEAWILENEQHEPYVMPTSW